LFHIICYIVGIPAIDGGSSDSQAGKQECKNRLHFDGGKKGVSVWLEEAVGWRITKKGKTEDERTSFNTIILPYLHKFSSWIAEYRLMEMFSDAEKIL
jgi:hypothetical protein